MEYRLALQDGKGQIVAVQQADGAFHAHSTETRVLDRDEYRKQDNGLLGRKGETVRVPSPLEDAQCPDDAFADVRIVLVDDRGEPRAAVGVLRAPAK